MKQLKKNTIIILCLTTNHKFYYTFRHELYNKILLDKFSIISNFPQVKNPTPQRCGAGSRPCVVPLVVHKLNFYHDPIVRQVQQQARQALLMRQKPQVFAAMSSFAEARGHMTAAFETMVALHSELANHDA